ncbi:hypothetical protein DL770_005947 [Monosporascus sp. CRB-9-2]|nr:hypothetical protein DL770_005947 [Monosporascus sp. CRB-9-2]
MHGTKWTKVSEEVGSRNGDQCWKRWHDNLDPQIDHSPWTREEDAVLLQMVQETGRNWRDIVNKNFPNRTPLSAKNRYGLLQRRQDNNGDYSSSSEREPSFTPKPGPHAVQTSTAEMIRASDIHSGTRLSTISSPFAFDMSGDLTVTNMNTQDIGATSTVLDESAFWPIGVPVTNSDSLTRRFLNMPTQSDTRLSEGDFESAAGIVPDRSKTLHVTVSCNAGRLEEVMHHISKNMSEMMATGEIQRVGYSVE